MVNKDGLQFGNWQVGGTELNLNGILKLNNDTNEFELELYSDELLSLPYKTDVVYGNVKHIMEKLILCMDVVFEDQNQHLLFMIINQGIYIMLIVVMY